MRQFPRPIDPNPSRLCYVLGLTLPALRTQEFRTQADAFESFALSDFNTPGIV